MTNVFAHGCFQKKYLVSYLDFLIGLKMDPNADSVKGETVILFRHMIKKTTYGTAKALFGYFFIIHGWNRPTRVSALTAQIPLCNPSDSSWIHSTPKERVSFSRGSKWDMVY